MDNPARNEYRRLKTAGFDVSKHPTFRFNSGSESITHAFAKLVSAYVGLNNDYKADCEVDCPGGEIDVLLYAPDRINWAVECESNVSDETIADKRTRYVDSNNVVDDIAVIPVDNLPANIYDMRDEIVTELGFF